MKTCPFCAESDLQDAALVCKHCGRQLAPKYVAGAGVKPLKIETPQTPTAAVAKDAGNRRHLWIALAIVVVAAGALFAVRASQDDAVPKRWPAPTPVAATSPTPSRGDLLLAEAAKEKERAAARQRELDEQARRMNAAFVRQEREAAAKRIRDAEEAKAAAEQRALMEAKQAERRAAVKQSLKVLSVKVGSPAQLEAWRAGSGSPLHAVLSAVNAVHAVWQAKPVSSAGREIEALSVALGKVSGVVTASCPDAVVQETAERAVEGLKAGVGFFKAGQFAAAVESLDSGGATLRGLGF